MKEMELIALRKRSIYLFELIKGALNVIGEKI
jgi:hypothetical protein